MKSHHLNPPNMTLVGVTLALLFFGVAALASASAIPSWNNFGNTYYYLVHQIVFGLFPGLIALVVMSRINYHFWRRTAPLVMLAALGLLVAVLIPGIGIEINGSKSWINLGITVFQPSEFAKIAIIIYLAAWFDKKRDNLHDLLTGYLPSMVMVGLVAVLIYAQPDLGTLTVICLIVASMFFTAGSRLKHLAATGALAFAGLLLAIKAAPYRAARIITFLDPSHDPQGVGYHVNQALLAVGSGGLFGYGYNRSLQKHNYLPEQMGDSIFAIIAEEMGFVRASLFILLFAWFAFLGLKVARRAPDNFGKLVAVGITAGITLQAFINIGANLAIMPLTGVTLPLVSYGSSSLITTLAAIGILINISRHETV